MDFIIQLNLTSTLLELYSNNSNRSKKGIQITELAFAKMRDKKIKVTLMLHC